MGVTRLVWAGALMAGACAIGLGAMKGKDGPDVDRELFAVVNRGHGPEADRAFAGITQLGSFYASGAAAGVLLVAGRRPAALRALGAPGPTWRGRPGLQRGVRPPAICRSGATTKPGSDWLTAAASPTSRSARPPRQ